MAPKQGTEPEYVQEGDQLQLDDVVTDIKNESTSADQQEKPPPMQIVWRNVFWMAYLHLMALYGLYLSPWASPRTWLWTLLMAVCSAVGITAGAHRLWAHRSYKARLPLRILLVIFNTMAFQNHVIEWARDHRVHHKYSETDADPHNAKRGFFFAHCGWLMVRKHPQVKEKGAKLDLSDLYADPVLRLQKRFYMPALVFFCFVFPALVPWYFWGEAGITAFAFAAVARYVIVLNFTWCVNSVAHMWGNRPYDKDISPVESLFVTIGAVGEGYHNYHHTFPHDYSASELGTLNLTTYFIDFMALIGQVTSRKKVSKELVNRKMARAGDGTTGINVIGSYNLKLT